MDFNDKRFGGRDDNKDRTVPPDENYYANGGFDLNSYRPKGFYGREENRYTSQNNYNLGNRNENPHRNSELSPSEEFLKNFNSAYANESSRYKNQYQNNFDREIPPPDDIYSNYDNRSRRVPPEDFYSSYNSRQAVEAFSRTRDSRDRANHNNSDKKNRYSERSKNTEPDDSPAPKKKKHRKNKLAPVIAVLSALLAIIVIITATGFTALSKINYNEKSENRYVNSADLKSSSDVTNILLLGVDARASEESNASRSDTMMLVSIDGAHNCIKMVSFLRDSWVYIPCRDTYQRLNAACSYGGYSAVADTIEYNFGVKIDGYVVADFEMFKVMIDRLGGVKIDVTEEEAKEVTGHPMRYGNVELEAGKHKLTGEQALAYCRIRKIDTDWVRTERQRTVMEAVLKKAATSPVSDLRMLSKIAPFIDTDLTKSEIMSLAFKVIGNVSGGFKQQACPFDGTWEYATRGGASVIALNTDKNKEKIAEFIYE